MSIFARAFAGQNLTPAERAFLKWIEAVFCAGLVAALPIVAEAMAHRPVAWGDVLTSALYAFFTAVVLAVLKYAKSHMDQPLPTDPPVATGTPAPQPPTA